MRRSGRRRTRRCRMKRTRRMGAMRKNWSEKIQLIGSSYRRNDASRVPCVRKMTTNGSRRWRRKKWRPLLNSRARDTATGSRATQRALHGPGTVNGNGWWSKVKDAMQAHQLISRMNEVVRRLVVQAMEEKKNRNEYMSPGLVDHLLQATAFGALEITCSIRPWDRRLLKLQNSRSEY